MSDTHISTVYGVFVNRSVGMGLHALFVDEDDAWKLANLLPGVQGDIPASGWRGVTNADVRVEPVMLFADYEAHTAFLEGDERKAALAKLTPRERELLGLQGK